MYDGAKSHDLNVESETDGKFSETITNGWLASLAASIRVGHRAARRISPTSTSCRCATRNIC